MEYPEALKRVRAEKPKENFMAITFTVSRIVLPHKDGLVFMQALANAEKLVGGYYDPHRISEIPPDEIVATPFSHQEYENYKIAGLLDITLADVKEMQAVLRKPTT